MLIVRLHELLEFLVERHGFEVVLDKVKAAVEKAMRAAGIGRINDFLDLRGVRRPYRNAIKTLDLLALEQVLRQLDVRAEDLIQFETRCAPWDLEHWNSGAMTVAVVLGSRPWAGRSQLHHYGVGVHDAEALAHLEKILRLRAGIQFRMEVIAVRTDMSSEEAGERLDQLRRRQDVGAVVILGSEIANPFTRPAAAWMFADTDAGQIPARFRWSFEWTDGTPVLSDPRAFPASGEGLVLTRGDRVLPRTPDGEIFANLERATNLTFPDCGLLAMDHREDPLLILCAGHGGCGTVASVMGLSQLEYVERRLLEASKARSWSGNQRVFEPIWVRRRKPTSAPSDDMVFDPEYGKGWGFALDPSVP